jgi:hypothetical protein
MSDVGAIAQLLADRIEALVEQLLSGGKLVERRYWRCGSTAGERGQSLCVYLVGGRRGRWKDFSSGEHGDPIDLIAAVHHCSLGEAIRWARGWLGLGEVDPEERERLKSRAEKLRAERQRQAEREALHKRQDALRIFLASTALAPSDMTDRYLGGRGVDLRRLGRMPRALRTHPGLRHPSGGVWPAMVAAVSDVNGRHIATHRTWLEERNLACEEGPRVGKAPVDNAKMVLGDCAGGFIRLWRAGGVVPWSKVEPGDVLILGEGIEDVLSYVQDRPQHFAACTVGLSAMAGVVLPSEFTTVCVLAQNDPAGSPAAKLLQQVMARLRAEGREVIPALRNAVFKDHNDYIVKVPPRIRAGGEVNERRAS